MMEYKLADATKQHIQQYAAASEKLGELHPEILKLAHDQEWFKLFVPKAYGGAALMLPEILRLEEELAAVDGSLAWTVTLCSGAGWFAGFLDPALALEIFEDPTVCFAGSGAVGGTAIKIGDGYLINGLWHYASGAAHATIFTANCTIKNAQNEDILNADGEPEVKSFILKRTEVEVIPGWSYFGLVATGSHAFKVDHLVVPANRTFEINKMIKVETPGFDYPFLQMAETTLAVNSLGMARHFMELTEVSFHQRSGKKRFTAVQVNFFKEKYAAHKIKLEEVKNKFYDAFDRSWHQLLATGEIPPGYLIEVSNWSRRLAHTSREIVDDLFPYCGLEAAKTETEINRVWRDLHTASQHALLTFED